MSRIRSIHPGLWTDEAFVSLSPFARLLFMGMWNECDDKGLFVWSPLQLKMRLLPADNVDAAALMAEIEAAGCIRKYEIGGKAYGAVRNFAKFQRPKKPNDIHPSTPEILEFAGHNGELAQDEGNVVPHQFPTIGEKSPQMEDGGGKREDGGEKGYAFCAGAVRLTAKDRLDWQKRFHAIPDFDAELHAMAAWVNAQPPEKQHKWFATGSAWLNKRHQEGLANRQRAGPAVVVGV